MAVRIASRRCPCSHATHTEIGLALSGFGAFFLFLGVLLFFDRAFMALGNVSWGCQSVSEL